MAFRGLSTHWIVLALGTVAACTGTVSGGQLAVDLDEVPPEPPTCVGDACDGNPPPPEGSPPGEGNIGDGDVEVASVRQVLPDGFGSFEIFWGEREPWNVDMTRMMFFEDDNVRTPDGEWGVGLAWAHVSDLKRWTTVSEYQAIRHPMNVYSAAGYPYASEMEWSPHPGEESIVYAARLADRMIVRIDLDTGVAQEVVSYDPGNGRTPRPLLRRWTTDKHLIVMLDGDDGAAWVNGVYEVDVQAGTRQYFGPPTHNAYWDLSLDDRRRWPIVVSHGHGGLSPDRTLHFGDRNLYNWDGTWVSVIVNYPPDLTYSGFNHVSWRSSDEWFVTEDHGQVYTESRIAPFIDRFGLWQCRTDVTCRHLLDVESATWWSGADNWPGGPFPTLRRDGRQLIYTATQGKYSKSDHDQTGVTPWAHRMLYLVDLAPADR